MHRWVPTALVIAALGSLPAAAQDGITPKRLPTPAIAHQGIEPPPPRPPKTMPPKPGEVAFGYVAADPLAAAWTPVAAGTWTGFYVGASLAGTWGRTNRSAFDAATGAQVVAFAPRDGLLGGAFVGATIQRGWLVLGVEADAEARLVHNAQAPLLLFTSAGAVSGSSLDTWRATLRARAGYATDTVLVYVTAGAAVANWSSHQVATITDHESAAFSRVGWTLGTGFEYRFTRNWSGRLEYRYSDFGSTDYASPGSPTVTFNDRLRDNTFRFGGAYRFD